MTEAWARCAECGTTFAAHDDPDIEHCEEFKAEIDPDPGLHLVRDIEIDYEALAKIYSDELAKVLNESDRLAQRLIEANDALELWGAFDYELLRLAEAMDIPVDDDMEPLRVLGALLEKAYGKGYDAGVVDGAEDARQEGS